MALKIFILTLSCLLTHLTINSQYLNKNKDVNSSPQFVIQQVALDGNNINAWIYNTGIFDQDLRFMNTPGFEWPKGAGSYAIFTAGLSMFAFINNEIHMATASY